MSKASTDGNRSLNRVKNLTKSIKDVQEKVTGIIEFLGVIRKVNFDLIVSVNSVVNVLENKQIISMKELKEEKTRLVEENRKEELARMQADIKKENEEEGVNAD